MVGFLLIIIGALLIYIYVLKTKSLSNDNGDCDGEEDDPVFQTSRKGGCLQTILKALYVLAGISAAFFLLALAIGSNISKDEGVSATSRITSTAKQTRTPKPTATPKPTPTPVPDFAVMSPEAAASELAKYFAGTALDHKRTDVIEGGVCLEMKMKPFVTEKYAVVDCCKFALNVSESLFKNPNVKSLVIYYDSDGRDAYGNETTVRAMEILLYAATAKKINYDYMRDSLWTSTKRFLTITDRYYVHPDLSNGVYDK